MLAKSPNDIKNFVLLTEPGGEKRAHAYLKNEDGDFGPHKFEPFVPMETKIVIYNVHTMFGSHRRKREEQRAIFPGYLFLPLDMGWNYGEGWEVPIGRCPGLRKHGTYFTQGGKYRTLTEAEMELLRRAETAANTGSPFRLGEKVRILDGPFADHIAEISRMDDLQRIELLKDFLGQKSKLVASISQIAAV